ncbi:hypothetical protein UFOVP56_8 [uncultured Caudovirales phage]|uniref:Uncharacterized protein n=1 Tax=uncultured Caudovirales phage TaxID=2100421 RepID=A0A6J5T7Z1_9CAUD|nr:hypothetical protein UFOVP56_8 [uncultured Caudovirales phage]
MKTCIVCQQTLTPENWANACKGNYVNKCVECIKIEKRAYQAAWRKKNPNISSAKTKAFKTKLALENPRKSRASSAYSDCRKRALKYGMAFDLTSNFILELLVKNPNCPYFGWALTYVGGKQNTLASIDRIDSAKGYTKDNIQILSYLANLMKSSATPEELVMFAQGVLKIKGVAAV